MEERKRQFEARKQAFEAKKRKHSMMFSAAGTEAAKTESPAPSAAAGAAPMAVDSGNGTPIITSTTPTAAAAAAAIAALPTTAAAAAPMLRPIAVPANSPIVFSKELGTNNGGGGGGGSGGSAMDIAKAPTEEGAEPAAKRSKPTPKF